MKSLFSKQCVQEFLIYFTLIFYCYGLWVTLCHHPHTTLLCHDRKSDLACEQALRSDTAMGWEKEGELATMSLEFEFHLQWAIPENIHTQPRTASMFYPPLAFGNSKMRYPPPCPQNSIIVSPPLPFRISVFLEVHFQLSNAYMNKRTWIYASSRLWSSGARRQAFRL